jgi:hypothetical protein
MTAAAFPHAGRKPEFMKEKPFDGPWNNSVNNGFARPPCVVDRVIDTQGRKCRWVSKPVNVLGRLSRPARVGADGRINDKYADIRVGEPPTVQDSAGKIDDANAVALAYRPQRALPYPHPSDIADKPKLRALSPQGFVLGLDGE